MIAIKPDGTIIRDGKPIDTPATRSIAKILRVVGKAPTPALELDLYRIVDGAITETVNTPVTDDFDVAVPLEAAHQNARWGRDHDSEKGPWDWFWLLGYLGGKAVHAFLAGDRDKALHHCVTIAAACRNWHAQIKADAQ